MSGNGRRTADKVRRGTSSRKTAVKAGSGSGSGKGDIAPDNCDLSFEVDLEAIHLPALALLLVGTTLDVQLQGRGSYQTAVCVTRPKATVVGALSAFEGLAQLLVCLTAGHEYEATVKRLARASCRVQVYRSKVA